MYVLKLDHCERDHSLARVDSHSDLIFLIMETKPQTYLTFNYLLGLSISAPTLCLFFRPFC